MDTGTQPHQPDPPPFDLTRSEYYQVIHTLTRYLPPPVTDTPESLLARNEAAIAAVAGMLPTNANESALAAQCVAARAQADDVRLLLHAGADLKTAMQLNAQYATMLRASLAAHGHLLRAKPIAPGKSPPAAPDVQSPCSRWRCKPGGGADTLTGLIQIKDEPDHPRA